MPSELLLLLLSVFLLLSLAGAARLSADLERRTREARMEYWSGAVGDVVRENVVIAKKLGARDAE